MTHYLLCNYTIPIFVRVGDKVGQLGITSAPLAQRRRRMAAPKNFAVCRVSKSELLRVVYYDWDRGLFMITAASRRRAYEIGEAVNGYFSVFLGYELDSRRAGFWLRECKRVPRAAWSEKVFLQNLLHLDRRSPDYETYELHDLQSGYGLQFDHIELLARYLPTLAQSTRLTAALRHFVQSRQLFTGYMVGSYYHAHYRHERRESPRWLMEKRYYEDRAQYELGFVSAFKAIESFFGTQHLTKRNLNEVFMRLPFKAITSDQTYRRLHETFSGFRARSTYGEMIRHFLDVRNAVAAHANPTPPRHLMLSEDNLFEIQRFVTYLIGDALEADKSDRGKTPIDPRQFTDAQKVERWT